jgi:hypothetical protein
MRVTENGKPSILVAAVVGTLIAGSGVFAGITKVDGRDQCCPTWTLPFNFPFCLPCKSRKNCPPFPNENFGYYQHQWRVWPGNLPNNQTPQRGPAPSKDGSTLPAPTPMKPAPMPMKDGTDIKKSAGMVLPAPTTIKPTADPKDDPRSKSQEAATVDSPSPKKPGHAQYFSTEDSPGK